MTAKLNEILARAKSDFEHSVDIPYPQSLRVSPWWAEIQRRNRLSINECPSVDNAIHRAQIGNVSGFDHRQTGEIAAKTVNFKLAEMQFRFPNFRLEDVPRESKFSVQNSIVGDNLSSIFLTHLHFYLRTTSVSTKHIERVLEIGSGYGGLARIFHHMHAGLQYVLVDLPESLFYAHVFLLANFPNAKTFYVTDTLPNRIDAYDFVFVPAQCAHLLRGQQFDLTINTGSLQEMDDSAARYWMEFIQETISTAAFYSWNYFLNDKTQFAEVEHASSQLVPVLDPYWDVRYFRINDPILTIDCSERNWLEVYVERIPRETWPTLDLLGRANRLIDCINMYPVATNYWFQYAWAAIWIAPAPALIDAMLKGLELFANKQALTVTNNLNEVVEFGEVRFYRRLKEASTP